ncbi:MAG: hypothetical protein C4540_06310 [Candidatus Omnitrophota bacterium]|jgi:hypothetical protein|nr:MAG: hypothetical protein C4540_06310 [Candidatus Omnitrophota bacterium]
MTFLVGIILIIWSLVVRVFSLISALSSFPIVAGITAAYLWIRLDVWRDNKTIVRLAVSNEYAENDLKSRRADSRVAIFLLGFVAVTQAVLQNPKPDWRVFMGILLILVPISNWIARWMDRKQ